MRRLRIFLFSFLFIITVMVEVPAEALSPARFNSLAEGSVDLFRVINDHKAVVALDEPVIYLRGDGYFVPETFTLPSTEGDLVGSPMQFDAMINTRIYSSETLDARFFLLGSYFYLGLKDDTVDAVPFLQDNGIHEGWQYGNTILAMQCRYNEYDFTLGLNIRYLPALSFENSPEGEFDFVFDEEEGEYDTKEMTVERVYFDTVFRGYRINSLFSAEDIIEQAAVEKLFNFFGDRLFFGPSLYLSVPKSEFQPGFRFEGPILDRVEWSSGVFPSVGLDESSFGLSHAYMDLKVPILVLPNRDNPSRRLGVDLNLKASLSEVFGGDSLEAGYSAEIGISHVPFWSIWNLLSRKTYLGIKAGVSQNHYETLQRMPFSETPLYYLQIYALMD